MHASLAAFSCARLHSPSHPSVSLRRPRPAPPRRHTHHEPSAVLVEAEGQAGEPRNEEARGVAGVGQRDGRVEQALAGADGVGEAADVLVLWDK